MNEHLIALYKEMLLNSNDCFDVQKQSDGSIIVVVAGYVGAAGRAFYLEPNDD